MRFVAASVGQLGRPFCPSLNPQHWVIHFQLYTFHAERCTCACFSFAVILPARTSNANMDDTVSNLFVLDTAHAGTFKQALARTLSTPVAEFTFSELLDGLPTEASFLEFHLRQDGNPVFELNHTTPCPGMIERFRDFRDRFDPLTLTFSPGASHLVDYKPLSG
jgi:hypothetical protein